MASAGAFASLSVDGVAGIGDLYTPATAIGWRCASKPSQIDVTHVVVFEL